MQALRLAFVCLLGLTSQVISSSIRLSSSTWQDGGSVPQESVFNGSGCKGANISPALRWSGAPAGTKSFAVTIFDRDAPGGNGWWHWVIYNIPTNVTNLAAGAGSHRSTGTEMIQTLNDYGTPGYGGPCPPSGSVHHYVVTIHALGIERLTGLEKASAGRAAGEIQKHTIDSAKIEVKYGK